MPSGSLAKGGLWLISVLAVPCFSSGDGSSAWNGIVNVFQRVIGGGVLSALSVGSISIFAVCEFAFALECIGYMVQRTCFSVLI